MIKRYEQDNRMSQAVEVNGFFTTAGQVASDTSGDISSQTQQTLNAIDRLLSAADLTKSDLVQIQIWLSDIKRFDQMNLVYERWLEKTDKPVRACVESKLAAPEYLIEIQAFACRS